MVNIDTDSNVLYECLAILNSFLISFPKSNDVYTIFKSEIESRLCQIIRNDFAYEKVIAISLRLLKNLVEQKITKEFKIESGILVKIADIELVACLAQFAAQDEALATRLA